MWDTKSSSAVRSVHGLAGTRNGGSSAITARLMTELLVLLGAGLAGLFSRISCARDTISSGEAPFWMSVMRLEMARSSLVRIDSTKVSNASLLTWSSSRVRLRPRRPSLDSSRTQLSPLSMQARQGDLPSHCSKSVTSLRRLFRTCLSFCAFAIFTCRGYIAFLCLCRR
jgi:hypothetical protein